MLAHELTHTIQQGQMTQQGGVGPQASGELTVSEPDDPLEREAVAVAAGIDKPHSSTQGSLSRASQPAIHRLSWGDVGDFFSDAGEAVWDAGAYVGGKTVDAAKFVGGKIYDAGAWVYHTAKEKLGAAWRCAKRVGSSLFAPISLESITAPQNASLADVTGTPRPTTEDKPTGVLDTIVSVLKHPCVQILPGAGTLLKLVQKAFAVGKFLSDAWEVITNPDPLIQKIYTAFGSMLSVVPTLVAAQLNSIMAGSGKSFSKHLEGVWNHLTPKLDYLAGNWRDVLGEMAWDLLWPWPGVVGDLSKIWDRLKLLGHHVWDCEFNEAYDDLLAIMSLANSVARVCTDGLRLRLSSLVPFLEEGFLGPLREGRLLSPLGKALCLVPWRLKG